MTRRCKDRTILLGVLLLVALVMATCGYARAADVEVSWLAAERATGYKAHICDRPDSTRACLPLDVGGVSSATIPVTLGTSVYIAATAYNAAGESGFSNWNHLVCVEHDAQQWPMYLYTDKQLASAAENHLHNFQRYGMITPPGRARLVALVAELTARLDAAP